MHRELAAPAVALKERICLASCAKLSREARPRLATYEAIVESMRHQSNADILVAHAEMKNEAVFVLRRGKTALAAVIIFQRRRNNVMKPMRSGCRGWRRGTRNRRGASMTRMITAC